MNYYIEWDGNIIPSGVIRLPISKSIYNRYRIIAELSGGLFRLNERCTAEDSILLDQLFSQKQSTEWNAQDAGTTFRFLTAYLALKTRNHILLTGTPRMQERPVQPLVNALRCLGAEIEYVDKIGYPPLKIHPAMLKGGEICLDGTQSSQFISALLLVAPYLPGGLKIQIKEGGVSTPYIELTLDCITAAGVQYQKLDNMIYIPQGNYSGNAILESDWSAAAWVIVLCALIPRSSFTLPGLLKHSIQSDSIILEWMQEFHVTHIFQNETLEIYNTSTQSFEEEGKVWKKGFTDCPDLAPVCIMFAAILGISAKWTGVSHLHWKESDRLLSMQKILSMIGVRLEHQSGSGNQESWIQTGKAKPTVETIPVFNDHRLVMAVSLLSLIGPVNIDNLECVRKSWPEFPDCLKSLGFQMHISQ